MITPYGMPVWYELLTPDVDGAKRFYGEIVGWTTAAFPAADAGIEYTVFSMDGAGVGGVAMPPAGTAPGWLAYVHVADVDAKLAEAMAAGGGTLMPAFDMPGVGRMALATDPQGAPFYLMTPAPPPGSEGQGSTSFSETLPGRCAWNELATSDQAAALPFYERLLGWTSTESMPMGPMGDYAFIDAGETRLGAMMDRAHPDQPLRWTPYFKVPDADRAAAQVKAGGGQVAMGPTEVPGGQRVIVAIDPAGLGVGFVSGERAR